MIVIVKKTITRTSMMMAMVMMVVVVYHHHHPHHRAAAAAADGVAAADDNDHDQCGEDCVVAAVAIAVVAMALFGWIPGCGKCSRSGAVFGFRVCASRRVGRKKGKYSTFIYFGLFGLLNPGSSPLWSSTATPALQRQDVTAEVAQRLLCRKPSTLTPQPLYGSSA